MVASTRKRQKRLERAKKNRKERHKSLQRQKQRGLFELLTEASSAPIKHCCAAEVLWHEGIGNVLISRQLPNGNVAFAMFLVDMYCLGVKDVFGNTMPQAMYAGKLYGRLVKQSSIVPLTPPALRKLVEGAVEYARSLGLQPHPDYRKARPIFGDIDASECTEEFEYGDRGKPHFFAGPHDSPQRCSEIIRILTRTCGEGEFHCTVPLGTSML